MGGRLAVWALVVSVLFLAFGGLYGGLSMLSDPSGASLGMDVVLLRLPVANYLLPGVFLVVVMGLVPLALAYGLLARPSLRWTANVTRLSGHHWAWTGTLLLGVVLVLWLAAQAWLIGFAWPIQFVTAGNAVAILVLASLPVVRGRFVAAGFDGERATSRRTA
ncbi:MAG: hypothetical protein U5J97_02485 [Trueperaceae bacterium]|nr:hypothetical protein [Trueperaceae bacterium]